MFPRKSRPSYPATVLTLVLVILQSVDVAPPGVPRGEDGNLGADVQKQHERDHAISFLQEYVALGCLPNKPPQVSADHSSLQIIQSGCNTKAWSGGSDAGKKMWARFSFLLSLGRHRTGLTLAPFLNSVALPSRLFARDKTIKDAHKQRFGHTEIPRTMRGERMLFLFKYDIILEHTDWCRSRCFGPCNRRELE